jgi:hypothetical protein
MPLIALLQLLSIPVAGRILRDVKTAALASSEVDA